MPSMDLESRRTLRLKLDAIPDFSNRFVEAFYTRFFQAAPSALPLFTKPASQHRMFASAIDRLVQQITEPERLEAEVVALGRRHRGKGVQPLHLELGRDAFIAAIRVAAPAIDPTELQLFAEIYDRMVDAMTDRATA